VAVLAGIASAGVAGGGGPARELGVVVREGTLGVRARDVSATEVVAAVAVATGAAVHGRVGTDRRLSVEFDALPLNEALPRLLGPESFALRYGADGRLVAIELQGGPVAEAPGPPTPPDPRAAADAPAALLAAFANHGLVAVDGRLAAAFGASHVAFADVADAALRDTDPALRAAAMAAVLGTIEADGELRPRLLSALAAVGDRDVASALRAVAGARAEEVTVFVAERADDAALRARAASVLRGLRGGS
jgi:hypothetical protein